MGKLPETAQTPTVFGVSLSIRIIMSRQCRIHVHDGNGYQYQCSRSSTQELPFCWQHKKRARENAKALNSSGAPLKAAVLEHLTLGSDRTFEDTYLLKQPSITKSIQAFHPFDEDTATKSSLGQLDCPLEIFQMILSQLSLYDIEAFLRVNSSVHRSK